MSVPRRLRDRVAFVTGGSSGIGRATALALAREGAHVAVLGRNLERLEETAEGIRGMGSEAMVLVTDVRVEEELDRAVDDIVGRFGRIDIHIASAGRGGGQGERLPYAVVQLPVAEWDDVIDTNLKGVFLSNRSVLPAMISQGSGIIINISSSRGATGGAPYAAAYCASKHAVMGLTRSLAEELRASGIKVMAMLPDATDTPLIDGADATAPRGKMNPSAVADLMVRMILQPDDTMMVDPLMAPFPTGATSQPLYAEDVR